MSVYFKFNSELNYSHVDFDGLHISVSDLKKSILHQKRLGKATNDFDLLISNAQTKEEYRDEQCLIPKNTSLIVARIPLSNQHKKWEVQNSQTERAAVSAPTENINHDISRMNGSEEDKIQAMMMQSTLDYDPTNYQRVRGINQSGEVPANYRCHKCHKPGHWIKNCPQNIPGERPHHFKSRPESKKMTGIPRSLRDNIGNENQEPQYVEEKKRDVPEDLICAICKGIFKDAVMIPCCGSSYCDECVRTALLESEDNECPDCKEKGTAPGLLIPNRFLRNAVAAFHAESSSVLSRDASKKQHEEDLKEEMNEPVEEQQPQSESQLCSQGGNDDEEENEQEKLKPEVRRETGKDSESDEDDDNITVTVPPAHQQSRGATFRDSRLRRVPSQHDQYSHSSKNHQDESESYEEESSRSSREKRTNQSSYEQQPQGISTVSGGEDKNKNAYHPTSSHDYQHQPQGYNSGMMPQMGQQHSMYPQGPYHQQQQSYYQQNQMRPMRYDHQGNYSMRHHMHSQNYRPLHDNYGMRHHRPINNLANAVTQNIQQRYGTGIIDDPLEAFNRIMREKEMRKERYRRSRSYERKYSPSENRRGKNYPKSRKRSRSFKSHSTSRSRSHSRNRTTRGRSKSRSYSPRYRRKEHTNSKDRRDDRHHRSPARRGGNHHSTNNKNSRGHYKESSSSSTKHRETSENPNYQETIDENLHEKNELNFIESVFDAPSHSLDEQPPPPGDESEVQPPVKEATPVPTNEVVADASINNQEKPEPSEVNGSKTEHHHHHKKSRSSKKEEKEASSDDKKSREKKKRKKSKEHERKKSKKDRKEKKVSKTPEPKAPGDDVTPEKELEKKHEQEVVEAQEETIHPVFNRSDSILDINLEDEWIGVAPEVSKWEREENNKSLENSEVDVDVKKSGEEKVTSEVIKRAEHVLFTKAISAIRPKSPAIVNNEGQIAAKGSIKNRLGKKITEESPSSKTPPLEHRSRKRAESPENRRGKQLSSCIRFSNEERKTDERKRTRTPRRTRTRTPEPRSRHQRPTTSDKSESRTKAVVKKHSRSSSSSSVSTNSGETSKRHSKHKVKKRSRSPSVDSSGKTSKKRKKEKKKKKDKKSRKDKDNKKDRD